MAWHYVATGEATGGFVVLTALCGGGLQEGW